uniref:Uncharacterized protein n=1 Tax=Strombidinopsis acuminata TaxID=141414 RepID=A0A7S3U6K5_9SPIT|mmetsp:Transcript_95741/g.131686  ORF Transcript_95741/g.131686 Transcript_95741/m.131686 type:complete len:170 (+) Transcript_95741:283-792(+)|eukprot:scaffold208825_cov32-Tisochrysis_lutea.AAC.1
MADGGFTGSLAMLPSGAQRREQQLHLQIPTGSFRGRCIADARVPPSTLLRQTFGQLHVGGAITPSAEQDGVVKRRYVEGLTALSIIPAAFVRLLSCYFDSGYAGILDLERLSQIQIPALGSAAMGLLVGQRLRRVGGRCCCPSADVMVTFFIAAQGTAIRACLRMHTCG